MGKIPNVDENVILNFAKRLASNDKTTRDRSVKKLKQWLTQKSAIENGCTEDDMLKLWKGLHYCYWMSDKPLIQEQLSDMMSKIIHSLQRFDIVLGFLDAFMVTEAREWPSIDVLRLDKFMMLVRKCLRETLIYLHNHNWDEEKIRKVLQTLSKTVMNCNADSIPDGLKMHFIDIYYEELTRVGKDELSADQVMTFLEPYIKQTAHIRTHSILGMILKRIFREILVDAEMKHLASELPDNLEEMELGSDESGEDELSSDDDDAGINNEDEDSSDDEENNEENEEDGEENEGDEEENEGDAEENEGMEVEEAGMEEEEDDDSDDGVDVDSVLEVDLERLAQLVYDETEKEKCLGRNKKPMQRILGQLRDAMEGTFHNADPQDVSDGEEDLNKLAQKARRAMVKEEQELYENERQEKIMTKKEKKEQRKRERESQAEQPEQEAKAPTLALSDKKSKNKFKDKKKKKTEAVETASIEPMENGEGIDMTSDDDTPSTSNVELSKTQKKKKGKKGKSTENTSENTEKHIESSEAPTPDKSNDATQEKLKKTKKKGKKGKSTENAQIHTESDTDSSVVNAHFVSSDDPTNKKLEKTKKKGKKGKSVENASANKENDTGKPQTPTPVESSDDTSHNKFVKPQIKAEDTKEFTSSPKMSQKQKKLKRKRKESGEDSSDTDLKSPNVNGKVDSSEAPVEQEPKSKKMKTFTNIMGKENTSAKNRRKSAPSGTSTFAKFDSGAPTPPAFVKRAMQKAQPKSAEKPQKQKKISMDAKESSRRVSFGLHKNCEQSTKEYAKTLKSTPDVPFDPEVKPDTSILKITPLSTRTKKKINVKRRSKAADFF